MGNADTKLNFRKAVIQLTTKTQPVDAGDDSFWEQFWTDSVTSVQDVFTLVPSAEIRALREESPSNLATLCYKVRGAPPRPARRWFGIELDYWNEGCPKFCWGFCPFDFQLGVPLPPCRPHLNCM